MGGQKVKFWAEIFMVDARTPYVLVVKTSIFFNSFWNLCAISKVALVGLWSLLWWMKLSMGDQNLYNLLFLIPLFVSCSWESCHEFKVESQESWFKECKLNWKYNDVSKFCKNIIHKSQIQFNGFLKFKLTNLHYILSNPKQVPTCLQILR